MPLAKRSFPASIVEVLNLPLKELKQRILTENGLTIAQEEAILKERKNPDIADTLGSDEEIDQFFESL